ncbi:nmrA-like family domain-containing protein 1 [Leucoraja erinacea]|uniref:nmrA-like family domain-containing protein 1 n=1 Tax=Leucoraja erinaceus TaxID=7782 RepID=UPI00245571DF|nr:nmrA-like family domain-containing protein 1 [Leucoraja erinacea]
MLLFSSSGKRVASISGKLGVKHIVFSGLENVTNLTKGKLEVPHFDGKGEREDYFREHGAPMTSIRIAVNFLNVFKPVETGKVDRRRVSARNVAYFLRSIDAASPTEFLQHFCLPSIFQHLQFHLNIAMEGVPLEGVSVRDVGEVVGAILKNLKVHAGKETGLSTDKRMVVNILGKPSKTPRLGCEEDNTARPMSGLCKTEFSGAQELARMFQFDMKLPDRNKDPTLKLNPNAKSFDEWMSEKND